MTPADYDAWYASPSGSWIGRTEYRLLHRLLAVRRGDSILDIGGGTGWFTRQFSALQNLDVTGVDLNAQWLAHAREHDSQSRYVCADACALPFASGSFDRTISMTALCFVDDWPLAMREIVRVTRSRFVIGLLNRHSLLWREKGGDRRNSSYHGAHWHTRKELQAVLTKLPVYDIQYHSAVFLPSGSVVARIADRILPSRLLWGSCLFVSGEVKRF